MERFAAEPLDLPGTAEAARTHLALPMGTELSVEQVDEVIAACASGST
jgi:dTDP-4-amino-4,6-dideoxygalactose transaminase